jgi:hypothetical protein
MLHEQAWRENFPAYRQAGKAGLLGYVPVKQEGKARLGFRL